MLMFMVTMAIIMMMMTTTMMMIMIIMMMMTWVPRGMRIHQDLPDPCIQY